MSQANKKELLEISKTILEVSKILKNNGYTTFAKCQQSRPMNNRRTDLQISNN